MPRSLANLIPVALVLLILTGCSSQPRLIEIKAKPIEQVPLVLPEVDIIELGDIKFYVVNEENAQKVFDELLKKNYDPVIFGVTDVDYETMSVNQAKILQLVRQQKAVIVAYEEYYERQNLHITNHNESTHEEEAGTQALHGEKGEVETGDESFFEGLWSRRPWQ